MTANFRRREFAALLVSMAVGPSVARAQQMKRPIIGLLGGATASAQLQWTDAFVRRLHELGWVEGQTVAIEYRWVDGHFERSPEIIADFVKLKVDVIVTHGTPSVIAAKRGTSVIPIVFASAGDPVRNGLVASLAQPGGNVTGLSVRSADLIPKLVGLLRELLPNLRRVGILFHVGNPISVLQAKDVQAATAGLGLSTAVAEIRDKEDIAVAIESLKSQIDALIVPSEPLYNSNRIQINSLVLIARLPTIYFDRLYVETGGLMSYGPNWLTMWQRAAELVDKILRGAKPGDIPVEQPTKFELVFNITIAKALGLRLPPMFSVEIDEVID